MPPFARKRVVLTPEQRAMYRDEKVTNFRLVSSLVASYAPDTLGPDHVASAETQQYLSEIGAYAELAYSLLPIETVFKHLHVLLEPEFPLEGYPAEGLLNTSVVCSFVGRTADLPGFVAYRSDCRQLVVAISGTNVDSAVQALYDIRTLPHRHPSGRGKVHTGFWRLYKGIRDAALKGLKQGLRDFDVAEVVLCGHSMGSAVSQLLVLDLLRDDSLIGSVPMRFVGFGGPRVGTKGLVNLWRELVAKRRRRHGEHSFEEYAVKMHRDGVPVLPPKAFGYRHCVERPYYSRHGRLYHVPAHLGEYALFHVDETTPAFRLAHIFDHLVLHIIDALQHIHIHIQPQRPHPSPSPRWPQLLL
ncbi:Triacylglycerol lipase [Mycena chlorophos]|uniref:Triacylglycerol lipase n=1 Tax=Mycena chlorophos TaxID=658473 RepID=A0A8H6T3T7_MYCCL|nr:Triacylglycerol lipase [Mycena chlorophos]